MDTACVLVPHFPAWAFVRAARPRRPVVVVERGRVVAATRRALQAGVALGMSEGRARALAPGAAFRVRDAQLELTAWEGALAELHTLTPFLEAPEPGCAFLRDLALDRLRGHVAALGARGGLGPDRATARLAAARASPGHTLAVTPATRPAFLAGFPCALLPRLGFPDELADRLSLLGYPHLGAVAALSRRQLDAQFGAEGRRLHALLHPPAEPPVATYQPPPTITASVDFDVPSREPAELVPAIEYLVQEAVHDLRDVLARRVVVRITGAGGEERFVARVLPEATNAPHRLASTARGLLLTLLEALGANADEDGAGCEVHTLALELGGLGPAQVEQRGLFDARPSVYLAVRGVHRRFPGAIWRAVVVHALFPEEAVRYEPFVEA